MKIVVGFQIRAYRITEDKKGANGQINELKNKMVGQQKKTAEYDVSTSAIKKDKKKLRLMLRFF
jgi:hypothetical protein